MARFSFALKIKWEQWLVHVGSKHGFFDHPYHATIAWRPLVQWGVLWSHPSTDRCLTEHCRAATDARFVDEVNPVAAPELAQLVHGQSGFVWLYGDNLSFRRGDTSLSRDCIPIKQKEGEDKEDFAIGWIFVSLRAHGEFVLLPRCDMSGSLHLFESVWSSLVSSTQELLPSTHAQTLRIVLKEAVETDHVALGVCWTPKFLNVVVQVQRKTTATGKQVDPWNWGGETAIPVAFLLKL